MEWTVQSDHFLEKLPNLIVIRGTSFVLRVGEKVLEPYAKLKLVEFQFGRSFFTRTQDDSGASIVLVKGQSPWYRVDPPARGIFTSNQCEQMLPVKALVILADKSWDRFLFFFKPQEATKKPVINLGAQTERGSGSEPWRQGTAGNSTVLEWCKIFEVFEWKMHVFNCDGESYFAWKLAYYLCRPLVVNANHLFM